MARVDRLVTATTVNRMSLSRRCRRGSTAAMASAADAPQIATAPPVSMPKLQWRPVSRATSRPKPIVAATQQTTTRIVLGPSAPIWSKVTRAPRSPTPMRSTVRAAKSMPGAVRGSADRKWNAIPSRSASSITEPP